MMAPSMFLRTETDVIDLISFPRQTCFANNKSLLSIPNSISKRKTPALRTSSARAQPRDGSVTSLPCVRAVRNSRADWGRPVIQACHLVGNAESFCDRPSASTHSPQLINHVTSRPHRCLRCTIRGWPFRRGGTFDDLMQKGILLVFVSKEPSVTDSRVGAV